MARVRLRRFPAYREVVWTASDLRQFHAAYARFMAKRNLYVTVEGEILPRPVRKTRKVVSLEPQ